MTLLNLLQFIDKTQWIVLVGVEDNILCEGDRLMLTKNLKYEELFYTVNKIEVRGNHKLFIYYDK